MRHKENLLTGAMTKRTWAVALIVVFVVLVAVLTQRETDPAETVSTKPAAALQGRDPQPIDEPASESVGLKPEGLSQRDKDAKRAPPFPTDGRWYSEIVTTAYLGGNPKEANLASQIINNCRTANDLRNALERQRSKSGAKTEQIVELIKLSDNEVRQCQSLTSEMYAWQPTLALRAAKSGVIGATSDYLLSVDFKVSDEIRPIVLENLRRDASAGSKRAIADIALHGKDFGANSIEQRAHIIALKSFSTPTQLAWLQRIEAAQGPLTKEEEDLAQRQAEKLGSGLKQNL